MPNYCLPSIHLILLSRSVHCTEVRFASFLSSKFTNMAVINPPERKLAERTSEKFRQGKKLLNDAWGQCTEVPFTSFFSGGFTTVAVINPPERKLAKRTSV